MDSYNNARIAEKHFLLRMRSATTAAVSLTGCPPPSPSNPYAAANANNHCLLCENEKTGTLIGLLVAILLILAAMIVLGFFLIHQLNQNDTTNHTSELAAVAQTETTENG